MAKTSLHAFKAKDTRFVADWLKSKGLHKLCSVFEDISRTIYIVNLNARLIEQLRWNLKFTLAVRSALHLNLYFIELCWSWSSLRYCLYKWSFLYSLPHLYYLWHVRVLSIKPRLHTQLPEHNKSYRKVSREWGHFITWNWPMMGHLNSFSASGGGNLKKKFSKNSNARGVARGGRCWSFDLTGTLPPFSLTRDFGKHNIRGNVFKNFRQSRVLLTDQIEIHQLQPPVWPSNLLYGHAIGLWLVDLYIWLVKTNKRSVCHKSSSAFGGGSRDPFPNSGWYSSLRIRRLVLFLFVGSRLR